MAGSVYNICDVLIQEGVLWETLECFSLHQMLYSTRTLKKVLLKVEALGGETQNGPCILKGKNDLLQNRLPSNSGSLYHFKLTECSHNGS